MDHRRQRAGARRGVLTVVAGAVLAVGVPVGWAWSGSDPTPTDVAPGMAALLAAESGAADTTAVPTTAVPTTAAPTTAAPTSAGSDRSSDHHHYTVAAHRGRACTFERGAPIHRPVVGTPREAHQDRGAPEHSIERGADPGRHPGADPHPAGGSGCTGGAGGGG